MATQAEKTRKLLNRLNRGTAEAGVGDFVVDGIAAAQAAAESANKQGAAVADSAEVGSPTTAQFNALLASLRAAGLLAT